MRTRIITLGLLFVVIGCAMPESEPIATDDPTNPEPLSCTLTGAATCEVGTAPSLRVSLTNRTDAEIFLIRNLDASDYKWRLPHCYVEIIGPDGKTCETPYSRCIMRNSLTARDFATVAPGGTFNPYEQPEGHGYVSAHQLTPENFKRVGAYRIRFIYSTKSENIGAFNGWIGVGHDQTQADSDLMAQMFPKVPKVEVRSNEIVVEAFAIGK